MTQSALFIRHALISVFNKSNIIEFAKSLIQKKITLLSTEGTAQTLSDFKLPIIKISDYVQFPEIMNGRIKTLHHKIYAGVLGRKGIDDAIMHKHNIQPIDMLIINFYPFYKTIKNKKCSQEEIINNIDIGGPSIVRAAIKNFTNIVVIIDNNDYDKIINEINICNGFISLETRLILAKKALKYVIEYDESIYNYFNNNNNNKNNYKTSNISNTSITKNNDTKHTESYKNFPNTLNIMHLKFKKKQNIIYGENPHQKAALYVQTNNFKNFGTVATAQQLQGKQLSYNNIVDMDTALECVKMFDEPTCVIVKHDTPCGVASSHDIYHAYDQAYYADSISAFGGIIAINRDLDKKTAQSIVDKKFVEAIIAPNIHQDCLEILSYKKNIKVLVSGYWNAKKIPEINFKRINEGLLIQDYDYIENLNCLDLDIVTIRKPTNIEIKDALFCWKIVKFVKSNAIVCSKNNQTTGIGSGQTNRACAVSIATNLIKSKKFSSNEDNIQGSTMASDAFFTFSDGIHTAAKMGIRCIIQPGGSIKDQEIIDVANQQNIAMIFTHTRHFKH